MEIDIYHSSLTMPALGACIGACIYLLREYKNINTKLILIGFIIVTATQFLINYCTGLAVLGVTYEGMACSTYTPHINGIGYIIIALGIVKLTQALNKTHNKALKRDSAKNAAPLS